MTVFDYVPLVLSRTPVWVWAVLLLLLVLGSRRLKPKRTRLAVAALAPVGFTIWSLTGLPAAAEGGRAQLVLGVWAAALLVGAWSIRVHRGPRPVHYGGGVFLFAASPVPLIVYMLIFWTRYGLGVWAAFEPELAFRLTLAGIVISAATAGRFIAEFAPLLNEWRRGAAAAPA